jgi:hypothetical protein
MAKEKEVPFVKVRKEVIRVPELDNREEFRKFFVTKKHSLGLKQELEEVLWLHLKSTNMATPEKFEDGLKHFGI